MFNNFRSILFFVGLCLSSCYDDIVVEEVDPGGDFPDFQLVGSRIRDYLSEVDYSGDPDYNISYVENYLETPVLDMSQPLPVSIEWNVVTQEETLILKVSDNPLFVEPLLYEVDGDKKSLEIYNLIPKKKYYWKLFSEDGNEKEIDSGIFTTSGLRRFIYIQGDHVGNFRDLGGLMCGAYGQIKYGKLFRGAEVFRVNGGPYMRISEEGIVELRDKIGCTVELDFGDLCDESPLEEKGFEVYRDHSIYGFYAYDRPDRGLRSDKGRECLYNCIELVINKLSEGKSIYFHCNSGADRTGTLAFILESLCGVNDSDKSKDYEMTSFYPYYSIGHDGYSDYVVRKRNITSDGYGYNTMVSYISQQFGGISLNEKVYNMCVTELDDGGLGLNVEQINTLRSILLTNY